MPDPVEDANDAVRPRRGLIGAVSAWAGLLHEPGFRGLWLAQSVSQLGSQVT